MAERLKVAGTVTTMKNSQNLGIQIVGVGFQDPSTNAAWAEAEEFQYEIWTDTNRENWEYIMVPLLPRPVTFPTASHDF